MPRGKGFILLLALYSWPMLLMHFHRLVPSLIAAPLMAEFSITAWQLGWFSSAFFYAYALLQIPAGALVDRFGPRFVNTVGVAVAGFATAMMAWDGVPFAASVWLRALAGVGLGVGFTCRVVVLARLFPGPGFATSFGAIQGLQNLATLLFTTPLALLIAAGGWRFPFVLVGMALLASAVVLFHVRTDQTEQLAADVLVGPDGRTRKTQRPAFWAGLRFVAGNPDTWPPVALILGSYTPMLSFAGSWGIPFLRQTYGLDNATAASYLLLTVLGTIIFSPVTGWLSDSVLRQRRSPAIASAAVICLAWLYLLWAHQRVSPFVVGALLLVISCATTFFSLGMAVAKEVNPPRIAGVAIGVTNTAAFIGAAVVQPIIGLLIGETFRGAFVVSVLFGLLGLWGAWRMRETHCRSVAADPADPLPARQGSAG